MKLLTENKIKRRLMKHRQGERLKWATNIMSWDIEWKQVIFSDKKQIDSSNG